MKQGGSTCFGLKPFFAKIAWVKIGNFDSIAAIDIYQVSGGKEAGKRLIENMHPRSHVLRGYFLHRSQEKRSVWLVRSFVAIRSLTSLRHNS